MLRVHNSPLSGFIVLFLSSAVSYSAYAASQWCYQCVLLLHVHLIMRIHVHVHAHVSMCVHKTLQIVHVCMILFDVTTCRSTACADLFVAICQENHDDVGDA